MLPSVVGIQYLFLITVDALTHWRFPFWLELQDSCGCALTNSLLLNHQLYLDLVTFLNSSKSIWKIFGNVQNSWRNLLLTRYHVWPWTVSHVSVTGSDIVLACKNFLISRSGFLAVLMFARIRIQHCSPFLAFFSRSELPYSDIHGRAWVSSGLNARRSALQPGPPQNWMLRSYFWIKWHQYQFVSERRKWTRHHRLHAYSESDRHHTET